MISLIRSAVEQNVTFLDTAEVQADFLYAQSFFEFTSRPDPLFWHRTSWGVHPMDILATNPY